MVMEHEKTLLKRYLNMPQLVLVPGVLKTNTKTIFGQIREN